MYPFQIPNSYLNTPFPINLNYDFYRLPQIQENLLHYSYNYQNLNLTHENLSTNYLTSQQLPFFQGISQNHCSNILPQSRKRKSVTKKLTFNNIKRSIRSTHSEYKQKRKTFKYYDPSRAPSITSLRTKRELQFDLRQEALQTRLISPQNQEDSAIKSQSMVKLQILLKEPNVKDYPFLICKKRRYRRNSKRRYSVAYFEQRASYIVNKEPIPESLHPKNKVRKSRCVKNRKSDLSQSQLLQSNSQSEAFSSSSSENQSQNADIQEFNEKNENNYRNHENQMKAEVKSKQIFIEECQNDQLSIVQKKFEN